MELQSVTASQLIDALENHNNKGCKIVYMVRQTDVKLNKKHRVSGEPCIFSQGVVKVAGLSFAMGADYTNATNKALAANGEAADFQAGALWPKKQPDGTYKGQGEHVGPYTVRHVETKEMYFFGKPHQADTGNGVICRVNFSHLIDVASGRIVEASELVPYQTPTKPSIMVWHTYKVDSVIDLTYGGVNYVRNDVKRFPYPELAA